MEVLDVRGVEIEIVLWRDTDNLFEATFTDALGNPIDLSSTDATMVISDRAGGTVKFSQTNTGDGGDHTDAPNGVTRFLIPRATFDGLQKQRAYTWKYWIYRVVQAQRVPHFYGDVRVMAPPSADPDVALPPAPAP
jgi:hypothetical protein